MPPKVVVLCDGQQNCDVIQRRVFRDGRVSVPDEDTVIHVGDEVIAVTSASDQTEFVGLFSPHLEE